MVFLGCAAILAGCPEGQIGVPFEDDGGGGGDGGGDVFVEVPDVEADAEPDVDGFAEADVAGDVVEEGAGDGEEDGDGGPVGPGYDCQACTDDSECASSYFCVVLASGGGGVCLRSCDEELPDCPPRFDCVESRITPLPTAVCAPVGERCCVDGDYDDYGSGVGCRGPDCNDDDPAINPEAAEVCDAQDNNCDEATDEGDPGGGLVCVTGLPGACSSGVTACEGGRVICRPSASTVPETCDGVDNNCNGWVDEDEATLRALTRPCYDGPAGTEGVGACEAGVQTCAGGEYRACVGQVLPATERCDGVDEDCDTVADDGDPGGGIPCTAPAPGVCAEGVTRCVDGAVTCVSTITPGSLPERCDTLDNDCDGVLNNGFAGLGTVCFEGVGACRRAGIRICDPADPAGPPICDAVPGTPAAFEHCDGEDDDCDGSTDEGYSLGRVCTEGVGACLRMGVTMCDAAGTGVECNATAGTPTSEQCDSVDNDCDGTTDEGFAGLGTVCFVGVGACRRSGVNVCNAAGTGVECNAVAGTPATEVCDAMDNDCDGSTDEGFALGQVCTVGVGACQRSGVTVCNAAGTGVQCDAVAGTPGSETCNRVDDDCDGSTDEGFDYSGDPLNPGVHYALGAACAVGLGACRRGGVVVCSASGAAAVCDAPVVPPGVETCNYVDDDCDGTIDDGFVNAGGVYDQDTNCGACGIDCTVIYGLPGAYGTCQVSGSRASCVMNCSSGYFNLNGIPDDGCEFRLDAGAIYVSGEDATAADDAGCGLGPTATGGGRHPCRTIAYGISRASATGRSRVLVADALYTESVTLTAGISLLGGYRADTWERHLTTTLTTVRAPAGAGHRKTIVATGISTATTIEGFVIEGTSATTAGANSYAVYVNGGTSALTFSNNTIYAGAGAPGAPGAPGADGLPGVPGTAGQNAFDTGSVTCSTSRAGAAGGARTCGATNVSGGNGGGVYCPPVFSSAGSSRAGAAGSGTSGGAGGLVAYDGQTRPSTSCLTCYLPTGGQTMTGGNGAAGANGTNGSGGAGAASAVGSIAANEWVGVAGGAGGAGTHGSGGGGGASGGGGDGQASPCTDDLGATGGGGGSGGCGGTAGGGGGAGGGSFGIFVVNASASPPTLTNNTIYRSFGGAGGNGGNGGTGGVGGAGAAGGLKSTADSSFCTGDGGHGGNGGNGGHGGGGGGGAGGVSYGIYVQGRTGYGAGTNTFPASGGGGAGGSGGPSVGNGGGAGVAGASANTN